MRGRAGCQTLAKQLSHFEQQNLRQEDSIEPSFGWLDFRKAIMGTSFETYGSTITPGPTFESEQQGGSEEQVSATTLSHLQYAWNLLDLCDFSPCFRGNRSRRMYLKDLTEVRHGGAAYYSLGGEERKSFGARFLTLSRRLQELFIQCATACLQQNRFMVQGDLALIMQEGRGKRHQFQEYEQRASKRQRTACCLG